jgi:hypothetical protein
MLPVWSCVYVINAGYAKMSRYACMTRRLDADMLTASTALIQPRWT